MSPTFNISDLSKYHAPEEIDQHLRSPDPEEGASDVEHLPGVIKDQSCDLAHE